MRFYPCKNECHFKMPFTLISGVGNLADHVSSLVDFWLGFKKEPKDRLVD